MLDYKSYSEHVKYNRSRESLLIRLNIVEKQSYGVVSHKIKVGPVWSMDYMKSEIYCSALKNIDHLSTPSTTKSDYYMKPTDYD